MSRVRARGEQIRRYILQHVQRNPKTISKLASGHFKVSRQAIHSHLKIEDVGREVPTGDPTSLADAIRSIVVDRTRWQGCADRARRVAGRFSWHAVAGLESDALRDVIRSEGPRTDSPGIQVP